jgi:hypothetical protein
MHTGPPAIIDVDRRAQLERTRLARETMGPGSIRVDRHTLDDLDCTRRGPALIKSACGGIRDDMVLDSGSRCATFLQISIPRA